MLDDNADYITVNVTIQPPSSPITVTPASLPALKAGTFFSQTLTSTGGVAPYIYSLQSGFLPPGMSLTSGGVLSGTPTQRGAYSFNVRSTDSKSPTAQFVDKGYTGTVQDPSLSLGTNAGTAIQGVAFTQTLTTSGGVAPYSYQEEVVIAPHTGLPAGITLSGSTISGTTSVAPGTYTTRIRVTDSSTPASYFEIKVFTLTVSPPPSVSIAVSPASVSEDGATNLVYTVTRSLNLSSPTVVNITTSGTATAGIDYGGGVATVTIPAGATTATMVIDPVADGTVEANETVILTVATGTGYTVGAPSNATGTILNDDVPSASIAVAPASVAEDGATNLVYTVTLNQAALTSTSINFTVSGSATSVTDYAAVTSPLVIPTGSTTGTITVDPTADATIEADETVTITLNAGAGYIVSVPNNATGTILNDDSPSLSINDVSASEGNAGTTNFTFTVSLSAPADPGGVSFDIATANGTATIVGSDYVAQSLTGQTIPAGSSSYTFTVTVNGDTLNEPDETFFVNVTNVTGATVVDGQGVGTISNDDPQPSLSINDVSVTEGNSGTTNAVFTVTLGAVSGQVVTVNYATADGTASTGSDYTTTSGTLTFAPGQTTQTVTVSVLGDIVPEANETFSVNLSGAVNATIADNQGVGTITNDDVPVTVSPGGGALPGGTVATAYSQTFTASGGVTPYSYAVTAGTLPTGLTLSAGGTLSGTPTAGGTFNFTVTATDASPFPGPFSGHQAYSITIDAPTISLPLTTLTNGALGAAYSATISPASGGTAAYSYAITTGALPGGLSLNTVTGAITGTPSAAGTFNFSVTATDSSTGTGPYTATQAYTITVIDLPPVANPVSAMVAYDSSNNPVTLNITGGAAVSVAIGTLAAHGTATASGTTITYTPTAGYAGPDSFTYTATNLGGTSAPATVTVTVNDATITIAASGSLAAATAVPYSQTFTFSGGAQPWSGYQVTNLPAGLAITGTTVDTVTVSGTPTQVGTFNLNVSATDASTGNGPYTISQPFVLTVAPPVLAIAPASTTFNSPYGAPYSQAFTASGGTGPYTYAASGSLPPGVTLSGDTLSGTPTAPGSYSFSITATDTGSTGTGSPFTVAGNYTINVSAPTIMVNPSSLPDPTAAVAYTQTISASGGVAPYSFAVTAGSLPVGLTLVADGTLSGTSNAVGTFNFTVTATDAHGQAGSRAYSLTITAPTLTLTPAPGTLIAPYGTPYSQAFTASGGSGSFSYALTGALPAGLSFSGNTVSGTPTVPGNYPITVTITDTLLTGAGAPFTVAQSYTINVPVPVITIDPATLPGTTAGLAYSQSLSASGAVAPYAFTVTAGSLPDGLGLGGDGRLSGTTTTSGSFNFTVTATDANGLTGSRAYAIVVAVPTLAVTPATLPGGIAGNAYGQILTVSGGIAPYTAVASGTLPAGISFDPATLTYSGTPTQSGTFNIGVTVTDSTGGTAASATIGYTLTIAAPSLTLTPATVPAGTAGVAYAQTFTASGGIAPYAYTVSAGTLPAGVTLDAATGALSGTPTVAGSFGFSITATDSTTGTAGSITQAYTLEVSAPTIMLTPETLPTGTFMVAYAQQLTAAGGTAPYHYAVTAGALPTGILLEQDGRLSGSPSVTGAFAVTVTATDALGFTGERAYTLDIASRPDPAQDPEVRGLLNAQVESARRFATSQIGNIHQRMQRLHGSSNSGFSNALSMSARQACIPGTDMAPGNNRCDLPRRQPFDDHDAARTGNEAANSVTASSAQTAFGVWTAGMLRSGGFDGRSNTAELTFETDGVSAGADYRISDRVVLGMSLGYGRDRTHVGENGSRSDARAYNLAAYASISPGQRFFVDALLGYQTLDFDLLRHVSANDSRAAGSRSGSQWFGSVSAGADLTLQAWQVTPYLRVDVASGTLDGYTEQGHAPENLTYGKMDVENTTGNAGVRFEHRRQTTWGSFSPQLKAEYQHDFSSSGNATVQYSDLLQMPFFRTQLDGYARSRWMLGAGMQFDWGTGWGLRVDYRAQLGQASDHGLQLSLDAKF